MKKIILLGMIVALFVTTVPIQSVRAGADCWTDCYLSATSFAVGTNIELKFKNLGTNAPVFIDMIHINKTIIDELYYGLITDSSGNLTLELGPAGMDDIGDWRVSIQTANISATALFKITTGTPVPNYSGSISESWPYSEGLLNEGKTLEPNSVFKDSFSLTTNKTTYQIGDNQPSFTVAGAPANKSIDIRLFWNGVLQSDFLDIDEKTDSKGAWKGEIGGRNLLPGDNGYYLVEFSIGDKMGFVGFTAVNSPVTVSNLTLPAGTVGQAYTGTLNFNNNVYAILSAAASHVPDGLKVNEPYQVTTFNTGRLGYDYDQVSPGSNSLTFSGTPKVAGKYTIFFNQYVLDENDKYRRIGLFPITLQINAAGTTTPVTPVDASVAHAENTNILGPDGTVYRIVGKARAPYTSAGAFLSYKFNKWSGVVPANSADMALPLATYTPTGSTTVQTYFIRPRNGTLLIDKGTVYIITDGMRAGFASEAVFLGFGFTYAKVFPGDTSFMQTLAPINNDMQAHPNGTLINDRGTIYVMKEGKRVGFPSLDVLDSWGFWANEAVPANVFDRNDSINGVMSTRQENQMAI